MLAFVMGFFCISMLNHKETRIASVHSLYLQIYRHDVENGKQRKLRQKKTSYFFGHDLRKAELYCL